MNPPEASGARQGTPRIRIVDSVAGIEAARWDRCVDEANPFLEHGFLLALEESRSVGPGTGWLPRHLTLWDGDELMGAVPCYLRDDSWGEFIFDFQWAGAYERWGLPYYPKLTAAAPFTPATGGRLLVNPGYRFEEASGMLLDGLVQLTAETGASSAHILFLTAREQQAAAAHGFLSRLSYQFHWENPGYRTFDDYLGELRSQKRKHIRRERKEVAAAGLAIETVTGDGIGEEHRDALWRFYRSTHLMRGSPGYLTRGFFERIFDTFRHRMAVVTARERGEIVAGTLNFQKGGKLYGRYWGSSRHIPFLHFELCFYRLIDFAIENGIRLFEAGAQGEHKFLRGFPARPTCSSHWIADAGARAAIGDFLGRERAAVERTITGYNAVSPLKRVRGTADGPDGTPPPPDRETGYAGEE